MNSLLKRQLKKYLPNADTAAMEQFLKAVDDSYTHYEDQINLLQRSMTLSSEELYEANEKLRDEAQTLKDLNADLNSVLFSMKLAAHAHNPEEEHFNPAEYMRRQTEEIVKANKQREDLLKNLADQNQELNDYAHMVSHDLKAPLRTINTLIAWVIEDNKNKLDEESLKSLNLIEYNTEKMELLIKGILDYSSIDRHESESRPVDFNELLKEVVLVVSPPKHITITVPENLPKIEGNYYRFRQLFQNLIENAIKYNDKPQGIIEIGFTDKPDEYLFFVKDNGKGIANAYFEKIFNIFTKLDNNSQSSGIGLSIVKKIINRYNGRIWPESTEHEGTTFYFTLPKKWNSLTWTI